MTNPTFIGGTRGNAAITTGTSATVTSTGSVGAGSLMIVTMEVGGASKPTAITPPAGWNTLLATTDTASASPLISAAIFWKTNPTAGSFSGAFSWTGTATSGQWVFMEWTGQNPVPFDGAIVTSVNAASLNPTSPSITPGAANVNDTLVCLLFAGTLTAGTVTIPTGMSSILTISGSASVEMYGAASLALSTAAATGTQAWTLGSSKTTFTTSFLIQPAGPFGKAQLFESHPSPYNKGPDFLPPNLLTTTLAPAAVNFIFRDPLYTYHRPPPNTPEDFRQNLLLTTLSAVVTAPFVYYDFSAHPPQVPPSQFVPNQNQLPQIYAQAPVGAQLEEIHPPPGRPGQPERWRPFFELPIIYAQTPVGATSIDAAHPVIRPGTPELWKAFFDLASIYAQQPVGARQDADAPPQYVKGPEPRQSNLLLTTLAVTTTAPFVYYDFSAHPSPVPASPFVPYQNILPQIYAQTPAGSRLLFDSPPVIRGTPERWRPFFDLSQVYAQQPVGARSIDDAHPVVRPGTPEPWKAFFDLSSVYAQAPVGQILLTFTAPPPQRPGTPEEWWPVLNNFLPEIYAQQPVGARLEEIHPPPYVKGPEFLFPNLPVTTLGPVTLPFVYYDFSAHPGPVPPSQFVPNQNILPQIYAQQPVGVRQLSFDTPPVIRGNPELWETILNNLLPEIYAQQPVGTRLEEIHPPPIIPAQFTPPWLLGTTLAITVPFPFVYYDFSAHPPQQPPSQFVPNVNLLPQIYAQKPIGVRQLSFDTPPTVRGNPELWETIVNNQLPFIYSFRPTATWFDFGVHAGPATPAENVMFPNLVVSFTPSVHKAIEWILRARRRHNR